MTTPPRTPTWVEPDGTPSEPGEHPHYAIWDHEGRKWDTSDKLTARFTQWDDTVLVVTVDDDDPGDMGEPRTLTDYDDGPTTYVSVRAANRYPPPAEPTLDVERWHATSYAKGHNDGHADGAAAERARLRAAVEGLPCGGNHKVGYCTGVVWKHGAVLALLEPPP